MTWRQKAAPLVRWGGVLIGLLFAVSSAWSIVGWFVRANKSVPALVIYVYGIIFGLMLTIAELDIWPALSTYFGFLKLGSGRAWFLFFISTLCLSGSLSRHQGSIDHILLTVAGICGIILAILGLIIRNEPAVLSRSPADVPAGVANVFKRGERGEAAPTSGNPDQVI